MDTLYSVQHELVLKPEAQNIEEQVEHLRNDYKDRILGYIHERKRTFGFWGEEEYKFYILNVQHFLNHLPRPKEGNMQSHSYYTLNEITCGKRELTRENQQ